MWLCLGLGFVLVLAPSIVTMWMRSGKRDAIVGLPPPSWSQVPLPAIWWQALPRGAGYDDELRFFRDVEGRKVDFVRPREDKPMRFKEAKLSDTSISPSLPYVRRKFPAVDALRVIAPRGVERLAQKSVRLVSADRFLAELAI